MDPIFDKAQILYRRLGDVCPLDTDGFGDRLVDWEHPRTVDVVVRICLLEGLEVDQTTGQSVCEVCVDAVYTNKLVQELFEVVLLRVVDHVLTSNNYVEVLNRCKR